MQQGNVHLSPLHERSTPLKHKPGNPALPQSSCLHSYFVSFNWLHSLIYFIAVTYNNLQMARKMEVVHLLIISVYHEKQK